jgi:hypothetical protein
MRWTDLEVGRGSPEIVKEVGTDRSRAERTLRSR